MEIRISRAALLQKLIAEAPAVQEDSQAPRKPVAEGAGHSGFAAGKVDAPAATRTSAAEPIREVAHTAARANMIVAMELAVPPSTTASQSVQTAGVRP